MTNLVMDCPHCGAGRQSFTCVGGYSDTERQHTVGAQVWSTEYCFFSCNHCRKPVSIEFLHHPNYNQIHKSGFRIEPGFDNSVAMWRSIVWLSPDAGTLTDVPENILGFFKQGKRALGRGDFDAAGMTFRKSLDTATKQQIRELKPTNEAEELGRTLFKRIEFLHSQRKLTDELKDWAHIIRDEGNDAAHEEQPYGDAEAKELGSFTEIYLQYVFSLPSRIKAKRELLADEALAGEQLSKVA